MLCLLEVPSSFFIGVLFSSIRLLGCLFISSKSCSSRWGTALFNLFVGMSVYSLTSSRIYFDCGVTWLVGLLGLLRGDLCFFLLSFYK